MVRMQKAKSETVRSYEKKVRCACPGCGIDFPRSSGINGEDGALYCTVEHLNIAKDIYREKLGQVEK